MPADRLCALLVTLHQLRSATTSRLINLDMDTCSVDWVWASSAQANQPPAGSLSVRAFAHVSLVHV